jgi:hypothetical protein
MSLRKELAQLANVGIEQLLVILRDGVPLTDAKGAAVLVDGEPVYGPAPAAYFHAAFRRLKDLGIVDPDDDKPDVDALLKTVRAKARRRGLRLRLPKASADPDLAAHEERGVG